MIEIMHGPQQHRLSAGLDYYKPTMSQLEFEKHADAQVTFSFKNRGDENILEHVNLDELRRRLDIYQSGWGNDEIDFLAEQTKIDGARLFDNEYLEYLRGRQLPDINLGVDPNTGDLLASTTGDWPMVTFWETVVMSEVNELYFESKVRAEGLDLMSLYDEGDKRLSDKIRKLKDRPDIKIADFGTRRHFSRRWQEYVVGRLETECPDNFIGTSNVWLAQQLGVKPIGTFAHEMPMVYSALEDADGQDPLLGHKKMLEDWRWMYGDDLSVALTDTYGSEFFFADFSDQQAEDWKALRHDSGDPVEFGNKVIAFYHSKGIDPMTKTIVFSDGLDIDKIIELADIFGGKINIVFGWGTTLTNDLGLEPINIVMKATCVNGVNTVKLSDNAGKHTGPEQEVLKYQQAVWSALFKKIWS